MKLVAAAIVLVGALIAASIIAAPQLTPQAQRVARIEKVCREMYGAQAPKVGDPKGPWIGTPYQSRPWLFYQTNDYRVEVCTSIALRPDKSTAAIWGVLSPPQ